MVGRSKAIGVTAGPDASELGPGGEMTKFSSGSQNGGLHWGCTGDKRNGVGVRVGGALRVIDE